MECRNFYVEFDVWFSMLGLTLKLNTELFQCNKLCRFLWFLNVTLLGMSIDKTHRFENQTITLKNAMRLFFDVNTDLTLNDQTATYGYR